MPDDGTRAVTADPHAAPIDPFPPPDPPWGGFRAWIGVTALPGLALLLLAAALPAWREVELPWFIPTTYLVMGATYAVVAALALLDASCRLHARSLGTAAAATALATLGVPRALTFPGVVPGGIPGVSPQTGSLLHSVVCIAAPAFLTAALVYRGGALQRSGRALAIAVGLGLAAALLLTVLTVLLAPVLPPTVAQGRFTDFSHLLSVLALVPTGAAVALVAVGVRGDRRVAPSVGGALTLLLIQELSAPFVHVRFEPLWYANNLLLAAPAAVLLAGQLGLYRASVRAEREYAMETAALYAATRAMSGSGDPDSVLATIPRLASDALAAVSGRVATRCSVFEFEGDHARIVADHDPEGFTQTGMTFPVSDHPALIALLRDRSTVVRELTGLGPSAGEAARRNGLRRGAYAPVLRGDTVVGALALGLRARRRFGAVEVRLLDGLAATASLALTGRRLEALRQLQYEVARSLSVAESVPEAASVVLALVGEGLDCQIGNLWVRDAQAEVLIRAHSWHSAGLDVTDFDGESDALAVRPGQGLPGRVWMSGEPEAVEDIARRPNVARVRSLSALGLRGAVAVPIVIEGSCTGVLEVFSHRPRPQEEEILEVLVDIGRQLGQFLARKRAEVALHESADRLAELATTDRLTGLKNRREFETLLGIVPRERYAVLAIDVDGLKPINDEFGHEAGDVLLQAVAMTLRSLVRGWDVVARVGGDEFSVILPGAGGYEAANVAERMRVAMHSIAVLPGRARISVGWAAASAGAEPSATWRAADEVLYRAKRAGRDRVEGTEARGEGGSWGHDPAAARDAAMLTGVFDRGTVDVVFQPILDLRDASVIGYEALARPSGCAPEASVAGLFDAARRLGRIRDLDWLCRRAALREARGLPPGATLFLNISAAAFLDPVHAVDQLLLLLTWVGRSPEDVVLELTEQETIPDLDRLQLIAGAYREHGVRFAADDVGDGHSTLEVLAALDPEFIKIARSLSTTATRSGSRAAIRAAQAFARDRGAAVIAEGVESPEVARDLMDLGIVLGQGNQLALPAPAPRTAPLLAG